MCLGCGAMHLVLRRHVLLFTYPPLSGQILDPSIPHEPSSDAYLREYVMRGASTVYHPTSTAAIGRVVDSRLRVIGCDRLRVADASVMPDIVNANTNAACVMIGVRAAEFIAEDI